MPKHSSKETDPKARPRLTSRDIGRLSGVSQAVVSRAFTKNSPIRPETREKVLRVARAVGYRPNNLARGLVSRSSNLVAVIISNIRSSPWRADLLEALEAELRSYDRQTMLFTTERDETVDTLIPQILQYQPGGIVVASGTVSSTVADNCVLLGTPIVQINRPSNHADVFEVSCDNVDGGRQAAKILIENGHKRIALLGGPRDTHTGIARYRGFVAGLRAAGLELMDEVQCGFSYGEAFRAAITYLNTGKRPTGIFCTSDSRAFAVMNAARYHFDLEIPEDLSVVGFDDIEDSRWPPYELTTIRHSVPDLVARSIAYLVGDPNEPDIDPVVVPKLIKRKTVSAVAD